MVHPGISYTYDVISGEAWAGCGTTERLATLTQTVRRSTLMVTVGVDATKNKDRQTALHVEQYPAPWYAVRHTYRQQKRDNKLPTARVNFVQ